MTTVTRPRFMPHLRPVTVDDDTTYLLGEAESQVLRGRLYARLAPLLDGRPVDEIAGVLRGDYTALAVRHAVDRLTRRGYLCDDVDQDPARAAYWSARGVPATAPAGLAAHRVTVQGPGAGALRAALADAGLRTGTATGTADLTVVLVEDHLQADLADINKAALDTGRPWMIARPAGLQSWVGPLFRPGHTGCWQCLGHRLARNRRVESFVRAQRPDLTGPLAPTAVTRAGVTAGTALAATQVSRWLLEGTADVEGALIALDLAAAEMRRHRLVRRPQCPACGEPDRAVATGPVTPASRPKAFTTDGGHRAVSPQQTLERFGHHVSPLTGVVQELRRFPTGTDLITVYAGMSHGGAAPTSLAALRRDHAAGSAGKGRSDAQARASALCEAIERLSGVYTGDEPRVRGTWAELRDRAVHPRDLLQVSDAQYADRETWNREHSVFAWVPERFDESRAIDWTPAWSLTEDRRVYLPTAFCWYDYPTEPGHRFCVGDSNGSASGNNVEEAIVQGFMELVERDSVAIWWYNRLRRPAVDLDSFDDPYLRELRAEYERRGREVWALDLTTDLGVPTFAALSRSLDGPERVVQGYGAHCDPGVALARALTEMNQMYALISGGPLDFDHDPDNEHWYGEATVANQPYLLPDPALAVTTRAGAGGWHSTDLGDDVRRCADLVRRHGMRMLVLDQTRPDLELSVVKVVVPGLRHFWARYAPGRLYDVPVALGWLPEPTPEDRLNPLPVSS